MCPPGEEQPTQRFGAAPVQQPTGPMPPEQQQQPDQQQAQSQMPQIPQRQQQQIPTPSVMEFGKADELVTQAKKRIGELELIIDDFEEAEALAQQKGKLYKKGSPRWLESADKGTRARVARRKAESELEAMKPQLGELEEFLKIENLVRLEDDLTKEQQAKIVGMLTPFAKSGNLSDAALANKVEEIAEDFRAAPKVPIESVIEDTTGQVTQEVQARLTQRGVRMADDTQVAIEAAVRSLSEAELRKGEKVDDVAAKIIADNEKRLEREKAEKVRIRKEIEKRDKEQETARKDAAKAVVSQLRQHYSEWAGGMEGESGGDDALGAIDQAMERDGKKEGEPKKVSKKEQAAAKASIAPITDRTRFSQFLSSLPLEQRDAYIEALKADPVGVGAVPRSVAIGWGSTPIMMAEDAVEEVPFPAGAERQRIQTPSSINSRNVGEMSNEAVQQVRDERGAEGRQAKEDAQASINEAVAAHVADNRGLDALTQTIEQTIGRKATTDELVAAFAAARKKARGGG